MRVLIACESSGAVRRAFRARGHEAYSCDLLPADDGETVWHFQDDVRRHLTWTRWDMMIAHPPCTDLAVSGARWFKSKGDGPAKALAFVRLLMDADIPKIVIENPVSIISTQIRKPDQIIQPWWFGHPETKTTCLWFKGVQPLVPTNVVEPDYMRRPDGSYYLDARGKRYSRIHFMSGHSGDGCRRQRERAKTYPGVADAFAQQWG
jgi:hypothetical protein